MNNSKGHVKKRKLKKWVKCLLILFLIFTLMFTTYKFLFSKTSFKISSKENSAIPVT